VTIRQLTPVHLLLCSAAEDLPRRESAGDRSTETATMKPKTGVDLARQDLGKLPLGTRQGSDEASGRDGRVRFNGQFYPSLSLAAKSVAKRSINGWWFWQVEKGKDNWVRLYKVRKAGTPVYSR
jgi:hypothetical protein